MTHKQFLLLLAVWFVVITLIFATPTRSAEIGLVNPSAALCTQAADDAGAVVERLSRLWEMLSRTEQESTILVLNTEIAALKTLGVKIHWWINENCRDA